jgi:hypothetical protein
MCDVRIGGKLAEYIALTLKGRERPDSTDYWDANWLVCTAEVAASTFRGSVDSSLITEDLVQFHQQVQQLYERPGGEAELTTMEGWLTLRLTGDGRGHVEATCRLRDPAASANTLECCLNLDQSYLPPLLRQLATVLKTYPVLHGQA